MSVFVDTVTLDHVCAARERIAGRVALTPAPVAQPLSAHVGATVRCKLESLQPTGSFKVRGAWSHLLAHPDGGPPVAYSTGNHGRAVAVAARELGRRATIVVGGDTEPGKVEALRACGAEVRIEGDTQDDAAAAAEALARESGRDLVPPFDDPEVIAGQGTIALELLAEAPELDTIVVPVSGGGLIAGIALAAKALAPRIRIVGVGAARAPAMCESLDAGYPIASPEGPTLADSLRGGLGPHNRHTFALARAHVDETHLVDEDAIGEAMAYALRHQGLVLEGAATVGLAALLRRAVDVRGERVAVVVTGRNVALARVCEVEAVHRDALTARLGIGVGS